MVEEQDQMIWSTSKLVRKHQKWFENIKIGLKTSKLVWKRQNWFLTQNNLSGVVDWIQRKLNEMSADDTIVQSMVPEEIKEAARASLSVCDKINSQSWEDTQYIHSYIIYTFEHLSFHIPFQAFKPSYTFLSIYAFINIFEHLSPINIFEHVSLHIHFWISKPSYIHFRAFKPS